jgi:acetyl esterase/lipase
MNLVHRFLPWTGLACLACLRDSVDAAPTNLTAVERLEPAHLRAAHEARELFAGRRQSLPVLGVYEDFRAVLHIHAEDAAHTKGTRAEVLAAAKETGARVVVFTDHGGPKPETWRGLRDGILFLAGEENGGAGLLRIPADAGGSGGSELRFLSHIEERYEATTEGLDGMEICNRHTDAVVDKSLEKYVEKAAAEPESWRRLVEAFRAYPDEVFATGTDYRDRIFAKWDAEITRKPFTGIGANDAHQNQIFQGTTLDPYAVSFRNLSTHLLMRDLSEREVRQALHNGHAYVAHDWLCDPTGFAFSAVNNLGVFPMGDGAPMVGTTRVVAVAPLPAKLRLIHQGKVIEENTGTNLTYAAKDPGAYRLEAWLTVDGEDRPWIYSNPVYLKSPSLAELQLPSMSLDAGIEQKKNIVYSSGTPEDEPKHQLDLYVPKGATAAPVLFFVHGGAWRSGDRSQYVPLGNRFAREGILTVIPSYRLAPKHPHPAQIEDVAAAMAWTVEHIAEYGGDTNRIYLAGHSAGGHLVALLALDERYLREHHLSPRFIRGVAALSGVYDLGATERQSSVFGNDPETRRDASPLSHIRASAPRFVVSYCEWDYASLPAQARQFHAALLTAGVPTELVYIPHESHISEMVHLPNAADPTAQAVLKMLRRGTVTGH